MDIGKLMKFDRVMNAVAAGTSAQNSDIVDMQGYDGVIFLSAFGAIVAGAATSVKVQQDTDSAGGTMADLAGSSVTVADDDDNQVVVHDLFRPQERYVRAVISRATQNSTIDGVVAILYKGTKSPATDAADIVSKKTLISPAEGTA